MCLKKTCASSITINLVRFIVVLLVSIFLECFIFNFKYVESKFHSSRMYNVEYEQEEMIKINWRENNGILISNPDPQLIIEDVNTYVEEIEIMYSISDSIDNILLFYTNEDIKEITGELLIVSPSGETGKTIISVKDYVGILRIDLGESENIMIQDIRVVINPVSFHFSISRLIACFLIYYIAKGLFALQRAPDYGISVGNE